MKMPFDVATSLQWRLAEYLPFDSPHPIDFHRDFSKDQRGAREQWQLTVDMVYRLLLADLVFLWSGRRIGEFGRPGFSEEILRFCRVLAEIDPAGCNGYSSSPDYGIPWYGAELCMTQRMKAILSGRGLPWTLSPPLSFDREFIEQIEVLFFESGVPWTDCPLISVW